MDPFLVLGDMVQDYTWVDDQRPFRPMNCRRKEASYGVPNGDAIVRGLTLYARLGPDDDPDHRPEVCLRATDEVFRLVGLQLDHEMAELFGRRTRLCCRIYTVEGNVMVIRVAFIPRFTLTGINDVAYYLVYDSAAASLSLLPSRPTSCRCIYSNFPLVLKAGAAAEDKSYSLVLLAERSSVCNTPAKFTDPVLCLWSPPPSLENDSIKRASWSLKARVPAVKAVWAFPFEAHVAFSCNGNAVWGDLAQGIMYCSCRDLVDDTEPVVFRHVMLPEECRLTADQKYDWDQPPIDACRNMGCVGGYIFFVLIEPSVTDYVGETRVQVWLLDKGLGSEDVEWRQHMVFRMDDISNLRYLGLQDDAVAQYPIFRRRDDRAMYMLLREPYKGDGKCYVHLVCIDLSSSYEVRILSRRRLAMPSMELPVVLDPDFFGPPPPKAV